MDDNQRLIMAELWSKQIKETLLNDLLEMRFVAPFVQDEVQVEVVKLIPVSLPVAAAMGAAAVIIKNPVVSRRFWRK